MTWGQFETTYRLRNARVVAIVDGGGALVVQGDVTCVEGRSPTGYGDDARQPAKLQFFHSFVVGEPRDPDASVSVEADIVIDGLHELSPLEIRGTGWIGYDEVGSCHGWFEQPPIMLLDAMPHWPAQGPELSAEEWTASAHLREPKTTDEFDRASRARLPADLGDV